jgi:hypothetical protein
MILIERRTIMQNYLGNIILTLQPMIQITVFSKEGSFLRKTQVIKASITKNAMSAINLGLETTVVLQNFVRITRTKGLQRELYQLLNQKMNLCLSIHQIMICNSRRIMYSQTSKKPITVSTFTKMTLKLLHQTS